MGHTWASKFHISIYIYFTVGHSDRNKGGYPIGRGWYSTLARLYLCRGWINTPTGRWPCLKQLFFARTSFSHLLLPITTSIFYSSLEFLSVRWDVAQFMNHWIKPTESLNLLCFLTDLMAAVRLKRTSNGVRDNKNTRVTCKPVGVLFLAISNSHG